MNYFPGYLIGEENYFTHERCLSYDEEGKSVKACGYDLRDNEKVAWEANGTYSAHLFSRQAEKLVAQHATEKPGKVSHVWYGGVFFCRSIYISICHSVTAGAFSSIVGRTRNRFETNQFLAN